VKVAAYQAPLLPAGSFEAVDLIREQVRHCEAQEIAVLCCPEAILGGLADHSPEPSQFALHVASGDLQDVLRPLSSDTVTTIIGFTELGEHRELFNSAAIFHRGAVTGVYRKQYPAIRHSIYQAGTESPVFTVAGMTFGVLLCNDSNHPEIGRHMATRGAVVLFVPTNNALPPARADVVSQARRVDVGRATALGVHVIRADVAGRSGGLVSPGSSAVVAPNGDVLAAATLWESQLLVAGLASQQSV
jgi:5-aminopentanamidase